MFTMEACSLSINGSPRDEDCRRIVKNRFLFSGGASRQPGCLQELDNQFPRVVLMFAIQQESLINHQHPTLGHLQHLPHRAFLVAPKRSDEGAPVAHHHMAFRQGSRLPQQGTEDLADRRLARPRTPQEDAVERHLVPLAIGINQNKYHKT